MTKENVIKMRNAFKKTGGYISIMINENYVFSSNDSYIIWNDNTETLTVISSNNNTQQVPTPSHRGSVYFTQYDDIVCIKIVPELDKIDEWLKEFTNDETLKTNIKNSFKVLTDSKYFVE